MGEIILAGGHEVRPGCEPMDRRVVAAAGGSAADVVFLPTAVAAYDPRGSIAGAIAYFATLGVKARGLLVISRADANNLDLLAPLADASLIYLGGGDPIHLVQTLHGSRAWELIQAASNRGAVVGGSSAGAMVLCDWLAAPPRWEPEKIGLGMVGDAVVQPHYRPDQRSRLAAWARRLPAGTAIFGIPEQAGLLGSRTSWEVVGASPVTIARGDDVQTYKPGQLPAWKVSGVKD